MCMVPKILTQLLLKHVLYLWGFYMTTKGLHFVTKGWKIPKANIQ